MLRKGLKDSNPLAAWSIRSGPWSRAAKFDYLPAAVKFVRYFSPQLERSSPHPWSKIPSIPARNRYNRTANLPRKSPFVHGERSGLINFGIARRPERPTRHRRGDVSSCDLRFETRKDLCLHSNPTPTIKIYIYIYIYGEYNVCNVLVEN